MKWEDRGGSSNVLVSGGKAVVMPWVAVLVVLSLV